MTKKQAAKAESIAFLLNNVKLSPGDTVYTVLRHVSASGMSRLIDLYVIRDGDPWRITYHVARAIGESYDQRKEALRMGGCGMDMGFQAVYCLGSALWPTGTPEPHGRRNGEPDSDGGYALKHRWM